MPTSEPTLELTRNEPPQTQLAAPAANDMLEVIQRAARDPSVDMDKMERLLAMAERLQTKDAEKQFNAAFVALQRDLPVIVATSVIPNRGKYERFEDVMRVVSPLLVKHGFSVSFSMDFRENRILETCHLRHIGGHSQSNSFAVRAGGKADSDTQADCKAATTAKRNALLNCLNIVIRQDVLTEEHDVSIEGEAIGFEKAQYLRELVKETNSDEASFLRFAGAAKYEDILSGKYDTVVAALHKKQRR